MLYISLHREVQTFNWRNKRETHLDLRGFMCFLRKPRTAMDFSVFNSPLSLDNDLSGYLVMTKVVFS